MNYPLISEYIEAIKSAEDNFKELTNLQIVLGEDEQPVMTSGNFAVVFKMKDEETGKLYALKCFTKEQEGRAEAYHLIAEELKDVDSPYLVSLRFLEKELFVDTNQTDETEFPVLLMDWVEGKTLDKYLQENLDDKYALEMLAYRISQLAQWLIPQPFAHGDLKPDNILVHEDGTLVLVDYDGMYVPAMKGQKARELGSPDFRHPLRTENDFDEHIDDFPLASILLSLTCISHNPRNYVGENNILLFHKQDYIDLANSVVIRRILEIAYVKEIARLYALFILVLSEKTLNHNDFTLFLNDKEQERKFKMIKVMSMYDNDKKYCLACCLQYGFGCKKDIKQSIVLYSQLAGKGIAKAQNTLGALLHAGKGISQDYNRAAEWYSKAAEQGNAAAQNNLAGCYRKGQGVEQNYEKAAEWYAKAAEQGFSVAQNNLAGCYRKGQGVEQNYEKAAEWYAKAAEQGFSVAQYNLACCFFNGQGVLQNYAKAIEWYFKSAEQGDAEAQYNLGRCFEYGYGTVANRDKARYWYERAAGKGHINAQKSLKRYITDDSPL